MDVNDYASNCTKVLPGFHYVGEKKSPTNCRSPGALKPVRVPSTLAGLSVDESDPQRKHSSSWP